MSTIMQQEKAYEPKHMNLSGKALERYHKVHSQQTPLHLRTTKYNTGRRLKGKPYTNYLIRLPKRWADGLELKAHDNFEWTIINYDPVVLQLRKLEAGASV